MHFHDEGGTTTVSSALACGVKATFVSEVILILFIGSKELVKRHFREDERG